MNAEIGWLMIAMGMASIWANLFYAALFFLVMAMMIWVADRNEVRRMNKEDR
jgi:hypothetical protein